MFQYVGLEDRRIKMLDSVRKLWPKYSTLMDLCWCNINISQYSYHIYAGKDIHGAHRTTHYKASLSVHSDVGIDFMMKGTLSSVI